MRSNYPFTAIVGQERLKTALLVCAVSPSSGGVLVRGDKGSAKSTAARAVAELLPPISIKPGCLFNCLAGEPAHACEICSGTDAALSPANDSAQRCAPFITLPLGATEEMVIGTIDLKRTIGEGRQVFRPGLLASVNQGFMYIDEVNLLPDHLVDVLLDAAAMGTNNVQREGISTSHPTKFSLVGTMNEEEGDLRPQLLDRFGMMIQVDATYDGALRAEIVRRRLRFEAAPQEFCLTWAKEQELLREQILRARRSLPEIELSDANLALIADICCELKIASLRADIFMAKVSAALAALAGRKIILSEDMKQAAQLVLPHRKRLAPGQSPGLDQTALDNILADSRDHSPVGSKQRAEEGEPAKTKSDDIKDNSDADKRNATPDEPNFSASSQDGGSSNSASQTREFAATPIAAIARIKVASEQESSNAGRRSSTVGLTGRFVRAQRSDAPTNLAVPATITHSLVRNWGRVEITRDDMHEKVHQSQSGNLILLVVDCSGSLCARNRMEAVKGTAIALLEDAYRKRDRVAVISFRGQRAEVVLPPTRSTELAYAKLEAMESGGRTPLADALLSAERVVASSRKRDKIEPLVVLLSDGHANVSVREDADPLDEALAAAARLKEMRVPALAVDTEFGAHRSGLMLRMAQAMGAQYQSLEGISAQSLTLIIKQRLGRA